MLGSCGLCGFKPQIIDELITLVKKRKIHRQRDWRRHRELMA